MQERHHVLRTTSRILAPALLLAMLGSGSPAVAQAKFTATRLATLTPEQQEILNHMSIVYLDDGQGGTVKTIDISGVNVRIHNGLGATNGYPINPDSVDPLLTVTNGTGNLIVGYNELGNPDGDDRTGSHNVVIGHGNSFTSFGGLVGMRDSTISGPFASVSGGRANTASGSHASVSGGHGNTASGLGASISGGRGNTAIGTWCSVSGGFSNTAVGARSSVSGGQGNKAAGARSSVSGGFYNTASGYYSSVSGGQYNKASGFWASVSGGAYNTASGDSSSVSGGNTRSATDIDDWVGGEYASNY